MKFWYRFFTQLLIYTGVNFALFAGGQNPVPTNPEVTVMPFAGSDLIKHPTGIVFTKGGKLLVVESHTHFRPKGYKGPKHDQIVWLKDTDGDGLADQRSVFFEDNLTATMDIAIHPVSGAIYIATRSEILRVWDKDDDGVADADSVERKLVYLDTEGNYPHNGCSGLCFDDNGDLFFGIGENLGVAYTLRGSDGISYSDEGEGGNIWHCGKDGGKLRRFATGFWNPFGVCHAPGGHVFATDNDPSSRPPSRLHYVIEGGDHGYQFRYGRGGNHPFVSWDGELPGTLPMLHGTGEAPCDVLYFKGNLIVSSWSDHRVEVYPLAWDRTHFKTEREVLIKGGLDFRPVSFAVGPDGDLYFSDWVKKDYTLHGNGAIWRLKNWQPKEQKLEVELADAEDLSDPWNFTRALVDPAKFEDKLNAFNLLKARYHKHSAGPALIKQALAKDQKDLAVRLLALKWITDEKLDGYTDLIEQELKNPSSVELFHCALTARARLNGEKVNENQIQKLLAKELKSESAKVREAAFLLYDGRAKASLNLLGELYENGSEEIRIGVALALQAQQSKQSGAANLAAEKLTSEKSEIVRALLSVVDPATAEIIPQDPAALGRFQFHKSCANCHSACGFGKKGGPDLSNIGVRGEQHIRQSILDPSAEIAPQYEAWQIEMKDGATKVGFLIGEKGGKHFYSDAAGQDFTIESRDMISRQQLPISMMPPGLNLTMKPEAFEALVDWLSGLK